MAQKLSNLPVGAKVKFGRIYGNNITWVVGDKNHTGYPSSSVTLVTEKIIKIMANDGVEASNSDSDRKTAGNNRHIWSNILQWLNSNAASTNAWYTAQHGADAPPSAANVSSGHNPYQSLAGFLNAFTADEQAALLNTTLTVVRASVDGGGSETFTRKVFLLSTTEVGLANESSIAEGSKLAIFSDNDSRIAFPTADAVNNSNYTTPNLNAGARWEWWLRTPNASKSYMVRCVHTTGSISHTHAYSGSCGLRPALNLSSDFLVSDTTDSSGAYTAVYNQSPTTPGSITVSTEVKGGGTVDISWAASTDPNGNLSGYRLERSVNSGSWSQIYQGSARTYTNSITYGWNTVQYRVKAYDAVGAESGYVSSAVRTVVNNRPPEITGTDKNLGTLSASFPAQEYIVTDPDNDSVTVVEKLDGTTLRSYTATLGQTNTLTLSADTWRSVLNGSHTVTITATDALSESVTRTLSFTKAINNLEFQLSTTLRADDRPTKCIVNIQGLFPTGSTLTVWVCNNGNDASPAWEDITSKALANQKHYFTNATKTAAAWGFNIKVKFVRGSATGACAIQTVGGNFQ